MFNIGECYVDATTHRRSCNCSQGWSGDDCLKRTCYSGYCLNNGIKSI